MSTVTIPRWWLLDVHKKMGQLPMLPGADGSFLFSLHAQIGDLLAKPPPIPPAPQRPAYECPVCGIHDQHAYMRCNWAGCPDGRDPR